MRNDVITDTLRDDLLAHTKNFKVSWIGLGQGLYSVWEQKLYHGWGYEKFEDYTLKELGLKKGVALKLLKTYFFVEQQEPAYLKKEFSEAREAVVVPGYETLDVLRLAHRNKELPRQEYVRLRKGVFEKGTEASVLRKDLTAVIKERKQLNPEEERDNRSQSSIRRLLSALKAFQKDMETLKLIPKEILDGAQHLTKRLEGEVL